MHTNYPHPHSHRHDHHANRVRPVCAYCLHLLGAVNGPLSAPLTEPMRRAIEDDHECVEKATARQPQVGLPFN